MPKVLFPSDLCCVSLWGLVLPPLEGKLQEDISLQPQADDLSTWFLQGLYNAKEVRCWGTHKREEQPGSAGAHLTADTTANHFFLSFSFPLKKNQPNKSC